MENRKQKDVKAALAEAENIFAGSEYEINGKKVSEYRFFKTITDELKNKEKKDVFYWTDERVIMLLDCLDIKITKQTLSEFKSHFR